MKSALISIILLLFASVSLAAPPAPILQSAQVEFAGANAPRVRLHYNAHGFAVRVERQEVGESVWHIIAAGFEHYPLSEHNPKAGGTQFLDSTDDVQSLTTVHWARPCYRLRAFDDDGSSPPSNVKCLDYPFAQHLIRTKAPKAECGPQGLKWHIEWETTEPGKVRLHARPQGDWQTHNWGAPLAVGLTNKSWSGQRPATPGTVLDWQAVQDVVGHPTQPYARVVVPDCTTHDFVLDVPFQRETWGVPTGELSLSWGAVHGAQSYCVDTHEQGFPWQRQFCVSGLDAIHPTPRNGRRIEVRIAAQLNGFEVHSSRHWVQMENYVRVPTTVFVANTHSSSVSSLNADTGAFLDHLTALVELDDASGVAISRDGLVLYVTTDMSSRLTMVDILNPRSLVLGGSIYDPPDLYRAADVTVQGDKLGLVMIQGRNWGGGIKLYNIMNPRQPLVTGSRFEQPNAIFGNPQSIDFAGNRICWPANGLWKQACGDMRDPSNVLVEFNVPQWKAITGPTDQKQRGRHIFVGDDSTNYLVVLDAPRSNPDMPAIVGLAGDADFDNPTSVTAVGHHVWVSSGSNVGGQRFGAVGLVDVSDPTNPRMIDKHVERTICDVNGQCTPPVEQGSRWGAARHRSAWYKSDGALCRYDHDKTFDSISQTWCTVDPRLAGSGGVALGFSPLGPPPRPPGCGLGFESVLALAAIRRLRNKKARKGD